MDIRRFTGDAYCSKCMVKIPVEDMICNPNGRLLCSCSVCGATLTIYVEGCPLLTKG